MTKRILIGYYSNIGIGGIDKYLDNVIESIYQEDVQIDCLTSNSSTKLKEKLKEKKVNLYMIDRLTKPIKRYQQIAEICRENDYDIAYFNISECFNCICNRAVRKNSDAIIISHSHSSGNDNTNKFKRIFFKLIHYLMRPILIKNTDYFYSCSSSASKWMFSDAILKEDKHRIIRNTVDSKKFKFNEEYRNYVRSNFCFEEEDIVIGFVGNLVYAKNVLYLLDVFNELYKQNKRYKLLIVGDGFLMDELKNKCRGYGIEHSVIFTGSIDDVNKYYSAMDLFALLSNFEGLPIVGIEAQINGIHCAFSDHITKEIQICDNVSFHSIEQSATSFAEELMSLDIKRKNNPEFLNGVCFDVHEQKREFIDIFINNHFIK